MQLFAPSFQLLHASRRPESERGKKITMEPEEDTVFQIMAVDTGDDGSEERLAAVRLFGRAPDGTAVRARVSGFLPYFFVKSDEPHYVKALLEELGTGGADADAGQGRGRERPQVVSVTATTERDSALTHFRDIGRYVRVEMLKPGMVPAARDRLFREGLQVAEANVPFELRYCIDRCVSGASWVKVRGHRETNPSAVWTVSTNDPEALSPVSDEEKAGLGLPPMAPFVVLSFDIECLPPLAGGFPTAESDEIIQVACVLAKATDMAKPFRKVVLVVGECAPMPEAEVVSFASEAGLLRAWAELLTKEDPDFVIGYNSSGFDLPYLARRWELVMGRQVRAWGRVPGERTRVKVHDSASRAHGRRQWQEVMMAGRVDFDIMMVIKKEHKLRAYTLNAVSAHFLDDQKEDVGHEQIRTLHTSGPDDRRRLARYCLKDALLPLRLCDKLLMLPNLVEMSAVTGASPIQIIQRGMQFLVFSLLLRNAKPYRIAVPTLPQRNDEAGMKRRDIAYEGATVLEPKRGFHQFAVATLDFASLYPSIMMAHNLCYSTLVPPHQRCPPGVSPEQVTTTPTGARFVKPEVQQGLLPKILHQLLEARARTRKAMKGLPPGDFLLNVLNGRQLALKICANSVYGFTGAATGGMLPCLAISSSVTSFGRCMIDDTKRLVEQWFAGSEVLYGDTDSVMVKFAGVTGISRQDIAHAMDLGLQAAKRVSETFLKPISLEFEKVFAPFLLMAKKRYAGVLYTNPDKPDKIDAKGVESMRRDNCPLLRFAVEGIFRRLLKDNDKDAAVSYAASKVQALKEGRVDLAQLVVSKSLSRREDEYANPKAMAHVVLAQTLRRRDPAAAPKVGDRVPYVLLRAVKGSKTYECVEDPAYALEHGLPIDYDHYLQQQLRKPILRILGPVFQRPEDKGTHRAETEAAVRVGLEPGERAVSDSEDSGRDGPPPVSVPDAAPRTAVPKACLRSARGGPAASTSILARKLRATAIPRCMHCRVNLPHRGAKEEEALPAALCAKCDADPGLRQRLYLAAARERDVAARAYTACWSGCQRCQGSLLDEVRCAAKDCPVFYVREQLKQDLASADRNTRRLAGEAAEWFL